MKKIDLHAYVTALPQYALPHKDGSRFMSADEQKEFQKKLNIEKSVLVSIIAPEGQWQKLGSENNKQVVSQNPENFEWFCGIDPRMGRFCGTTEFNPLIVPFKEMGASGIGEVAAAMYVDDEMAENFFAYCREYDMPVLVRYTYCYGSGAGMFDDAGLTRTMALMKRHEKLRIIACYEGVWCEFGESLENIMRTCENFGIDMAGKFAAEMLMRDADYTAKFLNEFADRVYYATGAYSNKETYPFKLDEFLTNLVKSGKLSSLAYEKIIRKNAEKLLG